MKNSFLIKRNIKVKARIKNLIYVGKAKRNINEVTAETGAQMNAIIHYR